MKEKYDQFLHNLLNHHYFFYYISDRECERQETAFFLIKKVNIDQTFP